MKVLLAWIALVVAAIFLVLFGSALLRELLIELRVRRSSKTVPVPAALSVRQQWELKDPPAWERLPAHKTWRLRAGLREMGE